MCMLITPLPITAEHRSHSFEAFRFPERGPRKRAYLVSVFQPDSSFYRSKPAACGDQRTTDTTSSIKIYIEDSHSADQPLCFSVRTRGQHKPPPSRRSQHNLRRAEHNCLKMQWHIDLSLSKSHAVRTPFISRGSSPIDCS